MLWSAASISERDALLANTIAIAHFLCLLPFVALLSDRFGRKVTLLVFAAGFVVLPYPAFQLLAVGGFWPLLVVELAGVTILAGYSADCAVVMAEQSHSISRSSRRRSPCAAFRSAGSPTS